MKSRNEQVNQSPFVEGLSTGYSQRELVFATKIMNGLNIAFSRAQKDIILLLDVDGTIGYLDVQEGRTIIRPVMAELLGTIINQSTQRGQSISFGLLSTRNRQELKEIAQEIFGDSQEKVSFFICSTELSSKEINMANISEQILDDKDEISLLGESELAKMQSIVNLSAERPNSTIISVDDWTFETLFNNPSSNIIGVWVGPDCDVP